MLKQEELAFIKAISTLKLTPALLKELKTALSTRKRRTVVTAGFRGRTPGGGPRTSQRPPSRQAGKRKANELENSGDSMEPAIRRPAPDAGSTPIPAKPPTGEQAANSRRQVGPPEGGSTYADVLAASAAPTHPSGSLKPSAMDSKPSESAESTETANRRMSHDMSGPLSGTPAGTTCNAKVATAGERPNKKPIFITGLATPEPSGLGCGHPAPAGWRPN